MYFSRCLSRAVLASFFCVSLANAQPVDNGAQIRVFSGALAKLVQLLKPLTNEPLNTFVTTVKLSKAGGLTRELLGGELEIALQAPDRIRLASEYGGSRYVVCRDGQQIWVHVPGKKFGVIGTPDVAPFASAPGQKDDKPLGPLKLPVPPQTRNPSAL
jgi:hypothetical protein